MRAPDHGERKVVPVRILGGEVAVTVAKGAGVAVSGWALAALVVVVLVIVAAVVFVIWWVLRDSDRSSRLKEIVGAARISKP